MYLFDALYQYNNSSHRLYSIRLEKREGNQYESLLAKALEECSDSGLLWAEAVKLESRQGRKKDVMRKAIKESRADVYVLLAVARLFVIYIYKYINFCLKFIIVLFLIFIVLR